jgi:amidase
MISIKPTAGLVARDNVIVERSRGTIGPIARSVKDATLLTAIAGPNEHDEGTADIPFAMSLAYDEYCKSDGLYGSRLGVPRNVDRSPLAEGMNISPMLKSFEIALKLMTANGASIIGNANYSHYDEINSREAQYQLVGPAEYKRNMAHYIHELVRNPHNLRSIDDMIACTKGLPAENYPSRDMEYWVRAQQAADFESAVIQKACRRMLFLGGPGGIDGALDAAHADAIVISSLFASDIASLAGHPVVTVPLGFMPEDTPLKWTKRGDLAEERPNMLYVSSAQ